MVEVEGVDDPAALLLDPGDVLDVGVVDDVAVAGVWQVVVGQRVAAEVDHAAVAGLGAVVSPGIAWFISTPLTVVPTVLSWTEVMMTGHPGLAGGLVAADAEDPELAERTRVDQRVGGRVDAVVDADEEAGPAGEGVGDGRGRG